MGEDDFENEESDHPDEKPRPDFFDPEVSGR